MPRPPCYLLPNLCPIIQLKPHAKNIAYNRWYKTTCNKQYPNTYTYEENEFFTQFISEYGYILNKEEEETI